MVPEEARIEDSRGLGAGGLLNASCEIRMTDHVIGYYLLPNRRGDFIQLEVASSYGAVCTLLTNSSLENVDTTSCGSI